ncbi:MAG: hypothetical protein AAGA83_00550 [Cyanobacteria bacterium P01_F01_bin.116]
MNCHISIQLNPTRLKIHGHEIREAAGLNKGWVAGMRFFLLCLTADDLSGLYQLLDLVDEHNHLVSAIEIDLQNAISGQESGSLQELEEVVQIFSQTKQQVLHAIAQHGSQDSAASSSIPMSCPVNQTQNIYSGLIRKSYSLATQAQTLVLNDKVVITINSQITARNYKQTLRNDKSALQRPLPASAHV